MGFFENVVFCCIVGWFQPKISGCQQDFLVVWRWNHIFTDFQDAVSLEKIFEIVQENTLKCSKLISFFCNKKLSLNQNVWRDYAIMKQHVLLKILKSGWTMKKSILLSSSRAFWLINCLISELNWIWLQLDLKNTSFFGQSLVLNNFNGKLQKWWHYKDIGTRI